MIVNFHWDCGRMGDVSSTFICTKGDLDNSIGKNVYFGEILGKHSEIYGTLDLEDVNVVTEDQEFICKFEEIMGADWYSGHNPMHYITDEEI